MPTRQVRERLRDLLGEGQTTSSDAGFSNPRIYLTLESTPDCTLGMGAKMASHAARIGQVAQETGISIDTIRFYEKQGLLKRSPRTEGGFRLFGLSDIETLKFVRKAQELGFSLNEIRELLILRSDHSAGLLTR